jgi:putative ABC transport system substrate-binding protein
MRRREFITIIGGAAIALPIGAHSQQPKIATIGYFSGRSQDEEEQYRAAFLHGLEQIDVEGHNFKIEYRFSNGQDDRLPAIAEDLARRQVTVLIATDTPSALAAKKATTTIPIVFSVGSDPVKLHLVDSLNHPGGNATGVYVIASELGPKRLQLIRELVPRAELIACIVDMSSVAGPAQAQAMQVAAKAMGQEIIVLSAATEGEIDRAFATVVERKAGAIVYGANLFFQVARKQLIALAAQHAIPAIYVWPEFVRSGGLISYSGSRSEAGTQIGDYASQILRGAKSSDLPVVQSSKFDLAINIKTAKALGLTISPSLLATADEVIE